MLKDKRKKSCGNLDFKYIAKESTIQPFHPRARSGGPSHARNSHSRDVLSSVLLA